MAKLAARRAHLDLHVNLLTEKKVSKVLEVVDELRKALAICIRMIRERKRWLRRLIRRRFCRRSSKPSRLLRPFAEESVDATEPAGTKVTGWRPGTPTEPSYAMTPWGNAEPGSALTGAPYAGRDFRIPVEQETDDALA
ncbi:MAG: hypothetical protein ABI330_19500 [Caldimonas sp.]